MEQFRKSPKLSVAILFSYVGLFFNFLGICIAQGDIANRNVGSTNIYGLLWYYVFFYTFWIAAVTYCFVSNTIQANRLIIVALTTITLSFVPSDIESSLVRTGILFSTGTSSGNSLKVAGLVILFFPALAVLFYIGSEPDSLLNTGIQLHMKRQDEENGNINREPSVAATLSDSRLSMVQNNSMAMNQTQNQAQSIVTKDQQSPVDQPTSDSQENSRAPSPSGSPTKSTPFVKTTQPPSIFVLPEASPLTPMMTNSVGESSPVFPTASLKRNTEKKPDLVVVFRAKALYAYEANKSDINEISFAKGQILDIIDAKGRWYQATKQELNGTFTTGIIPSNFVAKIE